MVSNPCECGHSIDDHGGEPEWQLSSHCSQCLCVAYVEHAAPPEDPKELVKYDSPWQSNRTPSELAKALRSTRANMLGTDDEKHYWACQGAAAAIDELLTRLKALASGICGRTHEPDHLGEPCPYCRTDGAKPANPDNASLDYDDMASAYDALTEPTLIELPAALEKHALRLAELGHYDIAADVQLASERLSRR